MNDLILNSTRDGLNEARCIIPAIMRHWLWKVRTQRNCGFEEAYDLGIELKAFFPVERKRKGETEFCFVFNLGAMEYIKKH